MGQAGKQKPPTVAVVIPTIPPRERLLDRALLSAFNQTWPANQVIVQLDEEGLGAGPTRNIGWQQAETDFVAFLDDDDEFLPDHLELCMRAAMRTRADLVYPWFELVGWPEATADRPDALATMHNGRLVHPLGVEFGPEQARHMRRHAFIPATVVVRTSMLERVGGYPAPGTEEYEHFGGCEDWAMLVRLLDVNARFVHVPKRTWRCHFGDGTAGRPWKG